MGHLQLISHQDYEQSGMHVFPTHPVVVGWFVDGFSRLSEDYLCVFTFNRHFPFYHVNQR